MENKEKLSIAGALIGFGMIIASALLAPDPYEGLSDEEKAKKKAADEEKYYENALNRIIGNSEELSGNTYVGAYKEILNSDESSYTKGEMIKYLKKDGDQNYYCLVREIIKSSEISYNKLGLIKRLNGEKASGML